MGRASGIEWTDATFNPWWGCVRVSPACAHCYAERDAKRYRHRVWGEDAPRRFLSEQHWRGPLRWNRDAAEIGIPLKVFCASMADVFEEHPALQPWRERLWELVGQTPWLDWQILTKRPENVEAMVPWRNLWPANVWLGVSIENMRFTWRADMLRQIPAAIRFVSVDPLLGSLFGPPRRNRRPLNPEGIDWVIVGGESGPRARPTDIAWIREVHAGCVENGVAFFLKQLGGWPDKRGGEKAVPDGVRYQELPPASSAVAALRAA
jgi:protein gp37